jgi:hypothetical protein
MNTSTLTWTTTTLFTNFGVRCRLDEDASAPMLFGVWTIDEDGGLEELIGAGDTEAEALEEAQAQLAEWEPQQGQPEGEAVNALHGAPILDAMPEGHHDPRLWSMPEWTHTATFEELVEDALQHGYDDVEARKHATMSLYRLGRLRPTPPATLDGLNLSLYARGDEIAWLALDKKRARFVKSNGQDALSCPRTNTAGLIAKALNLGWVTV